MASKTEAILAALTDRLRSGTTARVERNSAVPEQVPDTGLIIVRDGDPGDPDRVLGGFDQAEYSHAVPIELYIQARRDSERDEAFDELLTAIDAALAADRTLGGLAHGMLWARPDADTEAIPGAAGIKAATLIVTIDYATETQIT